MRGRRFRGRLFLGFFRLEIHPGGFQNPQGVFVIMGADQVQQVADQIPCHVFGRIVVRAAFLSDTVFVEPISGVFASIGVRNLRGVILRMSRLLFEGV